MVVTRVKFSCSVGQEVTHTSKGFLVILSNSYLLDYWNLMEGKEEDREEREGSTCLLMP